MAISLILGSFRYTQVMRKADLIRKNLVQSVKNERNILAMANNPFVVSKEKQLLQHHCCHAHVDAIENLIQLQPLIHWFSCYRAVQVRFYYSFTSRENLYIVMEYLNGGDLYSLLRSLGAVDEEVAR